MAGDLLVAAVTVGGGTGVTLSVPTGWNRLGTDLASGTALKQGLFWKAASSGDAGSTVTWTWVGNQKASVNVIAVAGALIAAPAVNGQVNASSAQIAAPSLSLASTQTGVALVFGGLASGSATTPTVGGGFSLATWISGASGSTSSNMTAALATTAEIGRAHV